MKRTTTLLLASLLALCAPLASALADDYVVNVAYGATQTINASFVSTLGSKNLVKTGRGTLVSSNVMSNYTGTITIRGGAFEVKTTSDLGTGDGGTVVEDGGTLVVNMANSEERFRNESFTIVGTGDAAYGAAVYQASGKNNRFKLFKYLALAGDATIFAGTRLGVDGGALTMNGHTLTVKGATFSLRNISTPSPVGDLVTETLLVFEEGGSGSIGDPAKTLTAQNGGSLSFQDASQTILWKVVVGTGSSIAGHENDTTLSRESTELTVQANPATGALSVRDKRTGREWHTAWVPAALGTPLFAATPSFTLSGAELVVEANFAALSDAGSVFPSPLAPNPGDALVIPMSEGFRIPFDECDILNGGELEAWRGSSLSMPFFGVVDENDESGFMAILETPDDAKIKCFADASDFGVGAIAPLWVPECGSPGYTRRVRFVFFESGGYVAMAKRYRAYAASQGLVKTFTEKAAERPMVERLPGAANIWYFPSSGEPSHTAVAAELREAGIDRFLWSWNSAPRPTDLAAISAMTNTLAGRYDVARDVYYPDLLDALGMANPPASEITLNTSAWPNDVMWDSADSNDWRRGWTVTGTNGATYHCAAQCDIPAIARMRQLAGGDLTANPYTARFIDVTTAKGLEECYNPAHPMTRRVSRAKKTELLEMLGEEFGIVVGSEQGMDDFVPVCDYFEGMLSPTAARMPARRDGYGRSARFRDDGGVPSAVTSNEWAKIERYGMNERYRIPLFELVYHDCVAAHWYWFDYSNSPVYWWWKRDMFNALYGTAPMYIFDYQLWSERRAEFLASWRRVGGIARKTGFSEMVSHRSLTADRSMQETRFADGTVVVADFTSRSVAAGVRTNQTYIVEVPEGQTMSIDATFVAALGSDNLMKTGRGVLVSSNVMSNYTGTITVREGAFVVTSDSDLGTGDGGTTVESGATLVVHMSAGNQRFSDETVTIAGAGDAAYGAAVWQSSTDNDQFKVFKYLILSDDATIFAGTRLGVDNGAVAMNGHTLTIKGANFTFRNDTFPAPVGNIVTEANLVFQNGSGTIGDPSKTLTVRNGGRVSIAENNMGVVWRLVVEEGGSLAGGVSAPKHWGGDVVWNSTATNGVSGIVTFDGELTGTGVVTVASGTLALAKPPADTVGLAATDTASVVLPPAKAYSYEHKGLMTGKRTDGWTQGYNTDRADTQWSYCAYGPGPQLVRHAAYWDENDTHSNGKARMWCSRGYLWNREATNVTYTVFVGSVYENWIYLDGNYGTAIYDNKRDSWGSCLIEVPARSCRQIDIRTSDGKSYGGPRTDADKMKINGVIANDPTGWFFTTNAVSGAENAPNLAVLDLTGDGVIDMQGMPLSVQALSGAGLVTNVTTLTVVDSWSLAAADIAGGAILVVDGDLVFGNGCAFNVFDLRSLPVSTTSTVCRAELISGIPAGGVEITSGHDVWRLVLANGGTELTLFNVEHEDDDNPVPLADNEFEVYVPFGQTRIIDAALVAEIGTNNLVKTGRGTLLSSDAMAGYAGEITVRAGSLAVTTASDLGTGDGGTTVESGATLIVHMSASTQRFSNEAVTIAGDGDAMHGAAIWQSSAGNDQFKVFKTLTLSGDATIFAGTRLGVDGGTVAMNGHTLTVKGANFTFRNDSFPAPVGDIVTEANLVFMNGSGTIGDPSKTLTVRNGGRVSIAENNMGVQWRLVVEEGGCLAGSASTPKHWGGDVVWNSTATNGVSGIVTFDGELTGTGVVTVACGALTLAKPPADTVGLAASSAASIEMPQPKAYSYEHKGLLTGYRTDGWSAGFDSDRADTRWSHCPFGPGPQIDRSFWGEGNGLKEIWCSRGYLWNRETTNITVLFFIGNVYQSWVYLDGSCVYDNKRDSWVSSGEFEIPAGTCKRFEVRTNDGGANVYGGPRTDNDKFKINGVIANDPTGWLFTTNAVSSVENPAAVASLMLAGDGAIDVKNMPISVGALSGAGLVTNVTALTVADSWTLAAADIADGAVLVVDGDIVFGNGSSICVSALSSLPVTQTYTICRADSITGLASGARIEDEGRVWKVVLSDGGTTLLLENVSQATMFYVR